MDINSESEKILEDMEAQKSREEYEVELKRFRIHRHLIETLKKINVDELKDVEPENRANIAKALNSLHLIDFVKMENSGANVLGIQAKPIELSYTEKKALRALMEEEISKTLTPILSFARTMDESVFNTDKLHAELTELEERRRELTKQVAAAKVQECQLLQEIIDLKYGPHQKNVADLLRANVSIDQVKGEIIKELMCNSMLNQTSHTVKALQEMNGVLDEQIAKTKTS